MIQRSDNQLVDFTWLYAYLDTLGELEVEVWAHRTILGPGESARLVQEIEVRETN